METVFVFLRLIVFITGFALLGRMTRDRIKLRKTHFPTKASKMRWNFMAVLVATVTGAAITALIIGAPVTIASYSMFFNLAAISYGHLYLDKLVPNEEAENAARVKRADDWFHTLIETNIDKPD
jgi:hypothetical protein